MDSHHRDTSAASTRDSPTVDPVVVYGSSSILVNPSAIPDVITGKLPPFYSYFICFLLHNFPFHLFFVYFFCLNSSPNSMVVFPEIVPLICLSLDDVSPLAIVRVLTFPLILLLHFQILMTLPRW